MQIASCPAGSRRQPFAHAWTVAVPPTHSPRELPSAEHVKLVSPAYGPQPTLGASTVLESTDVTPVSLAGASPIDPPSRGRTVPESGVSIVASVSVDPSVGEGVAPASRAFCPASTSGDVPDEDEPEQAPEARKSTTDASPLAGRMA